MAVWQVKIYAYLKSKPTSWQEWERFNTFDERLSQVVEKGSSWTDSMLLWGSEPRHDVSLWKEDTEDFEVDIRIDLREDCYDVVVGISNILQDFGFYILHEEKRLEPTLANIIVIIQNSRAFRFVQNPASFLRDLSQSFNELNASS